MKRGKGIKRGEGKGRQKWKMEGKEGKGKEKGIGKVMKEKGKGIRVES